MLCLLVGLIAALAVLPLAATLRAPALRALVVLGIGIAVTMLTALTTPVRPATPTDRPIAKPAQDYVGSQSCRSCHPGEHASWHGSFHRTMTQPCTPATLRADLSAERRIELEFHGRTIVLEWRGQTLWTGIDDAQRPGRQHRSWHEIVQLTGSHHAQVLWFSSGLQRQLTAVPIAYRIAEQQWLPIDAVFLMPQIGAAGLPAGMWNENCSSCHATNTRPRVDVSRADTEVSEFGIACEACHGPGARHVELNRNPLRRYRLHAELVSGDDSIVQPQHLDPARSPEVCGQCHSVNILNREHFDSWRESGSPYEPGEVLADSKLVITPDDHDRIELRRQMQNDPAFFRNTFWPDGHVRVTGREFNGLLMSPCHDDAAGERTITCVSCHDMHPDTDDRRRIEQWNDKQLGVGMATDRACTQCHPLFEDAAARRAHTHHADEAVSCYDCHMPHTSWGLLKSVRSHAITSPDLAVEAATGRPNACNLCHLDQTTAWTQEQLGNWYEAAPIELNAEQRETASGIRWLLSGDAAQRAIVAEAAGRTSTQRASGTDWMTPHLGQLLQDPYFAVRFVARRSLRLIGVAVADSYDHLAGEAQVAPFARAVQEQWPGVPPGSGGNRKRLLLDDEGKLDWRAFQELLARRDDRPIVLAE